MYYYIILLFVLLQCYYFHYYIMLFFVLSNYIIFVSLHYLQTDYCPFIVIITDIGRLFPIGSVCPTETQMCIKRNYYQKLHFNLRLISLNQGMWKTSHF